MSSRLASYKTTQFRAQQAAVREINRTLKRLMADVPPGEHGHIAAVVADQNTMILNLKSENRKLRRAVKRLREGMST